MATCPKCKKRFSTPCCEENDHECPRCGFGPGDGYCSRRRCIEQPEIERGPYLQLVTPASIVIRWRTETPAASRVRYGSAPHDLPNVVGNAG